MRHKWENRHPQQSGLPTAKQNDDNASHWPCLVNKEDLFFQCFWELERESKKHIFIQFCGVWECSTAFDSQVARTIKFLLRLHVYQISPLPYQPAFHFATRSYRTTPLSSVPPVLISPHHILNRSLFPLCFVKFLTASPHLIYFAPYVIACFRFRLTLQLRDIITFFLFIQPPFLLQPLGNGNTFGRCKELLFWTLLFIVSVIFCFDHGTLFRMPSFAASFDYQTRCPFPIWPLHCCLSDRAITFFSFPPPSLRLAYASWTPKPCSLHDFKNEWHSENCRKCVAQWSGSVPLRIGKNRCLYA